MTALEVILIIIGLICVVVSFIMPTPVNEKSADTSSVEPQLSEYQLEVIRSKVEAAVKQEIENIIEKTEISLDRISNTKTLEMQEYADTIFSEMSRNHNETMFLYDMLNDKAKEVKAIVRDVNLMKQAEEKTSPEAGTGNVSNRELELIEKLVIQAANEEAEEEIAATAETDDGLSGNNETILKLYEEGMSVLEIAKKLNLGIGQTKLVIDLFKGTK